MLDCSPFWRHRPFTSRRHTTDGTQLAASESIDVRFLSFAAGRMVAGCENGDVHVWETGLFTRRFTSKSEGQNPASDPKKNALQEKLRKLRER